jgi:Ca2+-binding RTX toxin-like protein
MSNLTGTAGADTLTGAADNDTLSGGLGNDRLDGGFGGNDLLIGGDGADTIITRAGGGNDTVQGGLGFDTLEFRGHADGETVMLSASGTHAVLTDTLNFPTENLGRVEADGIQRVSFTASGGADTFFIEDMTATTVRQVAVDLGAADLFNHDRVIVDGSAAGENVSITNANGIVTVGGFAAQVTIAHGETWDFVVAGGGGGADTLSAATMAGQMHVVLRGGDGNDVLVGSSIDDTMMGDAGDDRLTGGAGADWFVYDVFQPAGRDVITDFQPGSDTILLSRSPDFSLADAIAAHHVFQSGADVVIAYPNANIVLQNVALSSLNDWNVVF